MKMSGAPDTVIVDTPGNSPIGGRSLTIIRRGRTEIIASLLEAAKERKSRTHLMYASELDSRGLRKYLDFLVSRRLVEQESGNLTTYKTTAKGLQFLEAHERLESLQAL